MKKFLFSLLAFVMLTACSHTSLPQLKADDLLHRNFVLIRFNNTDIQPRNMQPGIEFGENLYVTVRMCNYFSGNGHLNNDYLTLTNMSISKLPCLEPKYKGLDSVVSELLKQGAHITFDKENQELILSNSNNTLLFKVMDWVY